MNIIYNKLYNNLFVYKFKTLYNTKIANALISRAFSQINLNVIILMK